MNQRRLFFLFYQQFHKTTKTNPDKQLPNVKYFLAVDTHWGKITGYQRDLTHKMKRKTCPAKEVKTNILHSFDIHQRKTKP